MKRIELLKKTGIYFTAIALSAVIGTAAPVMTVFATDGNTEEVAVPVEEPEPQPEPEPEPQPEPEPVDPGTGSESGQNDTGGDTTPGSASDSGSGSGGNTAAPAAETSDTSNTDNSGNAASQDNPNSSNTNSSPATSTPAQTAPNAATTQEPAVPAAPSEAPAADTQTNQPQQTTTTVDPTGKYKDKGTTLNPGEVPTGYDQVLNYGGNNADLIASQNIISGLSIMKDDFRFFTVDKDPAVAVKEQRVYEDMDDLSREIGLLSEKDILYILSEEDDGWLYVESGTVRGFVQKDDVKRVSDSSSSGQISSFAEEIIPASENEAFTYKRCTTKSTVIDKDYAVADLDTSIMESTVDNSREIGHLAPGSLCYVLLQTDEKWAYVESGNVRGFARTANLTTGNAAKKIVQESGEVSMSTAEEYIAPADNDALYYTLTSVHDGVVYSSIRSEIVEAAAKCIGNPYVWGGTSLTNGADCSGFVQTLYSMFGYNLPRVADAQSQYGTQIPVADAAPGDLIFFAANGYVYHVAMYAGDGMTIEAYSENRGIIATPIGNRDAVWATRVIED